MKVAIVLLLCVLFAMTRAEYNGAYYNGFGGARGFGGNRAGVGNLGGGTGGIGGNFGGVDGGFGRTGGAFDGNGGFGGLRYPSGKSANIYRKLSSSVITCSGNTNCFLSNNIALECNTS